MPGVIFFEVLVKVFRLYRESGLILFNSFQSGEKYWITYQAATHGGGSMYDEIDISIFSDVTNKRTTISEVYKAIPPRNYLKVNEIEFEVRYKLREAILIHELKNYAGQKVVLSEVKI